LNTIRSDDGRLKWHRYFTWNNSNFLPMKEFFKNKKTAGTEIITISMLFHSSYSFSFTSEAPSEHSKLPHRHLPVYNPVALPLNHSPSFNILKEPRITMTNTIAPITKSGLFESRQFTNKAAVMTPMFIITSLLVNIILAFI